MSNRKRFRIPVFMLLLGALLFLCSGKAFAKLNATDYVFTKGPYTGDTAHYQAGGDPLTGVRVLLSEGTKNIFEVMLGEPKIDNNAVKGMTYDLATNTLTLDHFQNTDATIFAQMMGDDFTIRVIGDCSIHSIEMGSMDYYGEKGETLHYGGSLTITGGGTLTIDSRAEDYDLYGIFMLADGSDARLVIDKTVSLHIYGNTKSLDATGKDNFTTPYAVMVVRSAGFYDKDVVTVDNKPLVQAYPKYVVNGFMSEVEPTLKDYWVEATEMVIKGTGPVKISSAGIKLAATSLPYNGKVQKPEIQISGKFLEEGVDYTVEWSSKSPKKPGTYSVTITGKGDYSGTKKLTYKIVKAANPLSVKARTATVKYSKVKKKNQKLSVSKVLSFAAKGKGTMSYVKVSGSKKITINKKTGKITIKKGLKKGTYKVKVKVKAKGNSGYKASSAKTVTFRIKVK